MRERKNGRKTRKKKERDLPLSLFDLIKQAPAPETLLSELTDLQDRSEHSGVVNSGAVPASVSELPLALMDASLGAAADAAHVVLVQLAQFGLAGGEAGDLGAQGLRADQVDLRVPPYFVALETEIPAGSKSSHVNTSPI